MLPVVYTLNFIFFIYIVTMLVKQLNFLLILLLVDLCWVFLLVLIASSALISNSIVFIYLTILMICLSTVEFVVNIGILYNSHYSDK